jgi:hypothetical protein
VVSSMLFPLEGGAKTEYWAVVLKHVFLIQNSSTQIRYYSVHQTETFSMDSVRVETFNTHRAIQHRFSTTMDFVLKNSVHFQYGVLNY